MDFRTISVTELATQIRRGERSAREVTQAALDRIRALDGAIGAFVATDGDRAMEQAAAIDQLVASGEDPGPLAGVPIGVKDLEDAAGYPTTHGSPLWAADPPATHDSPQVTRLRAAGCVVVGKTNTPELGCAATTDNTLFGPTANPWDLSRSPGGSSGGSAAAVAAGMVPLATGSDGGGSIRIPSSCCGLSGMKPSLGRVPDGDAQPPGWPDLSIRGPIARRIGDVTAALDVVVSPEQGDLRSLPRPEASWPAATVDPHLPARVAWSPTLGYATVDTEVLTVCEAAVAQLVASGVDVVQVDEVFPEDPVRHWVHMTSAYLARSVEPYRDDPAWERIDPTLAFLADAGRRVTGVQFVQATDAAHHLNQRLVALFRDVRVLLTPTVAAPPPPRALGGAALVNGTEERNWVPFTYPFNLTRSPAATVCAGLTADGLPVGLQVVGPQHGDLVVLRSAAALEALLGLADLPDLPENAKDPGSPRIR